VFEDGVVRARAGGPRQLRDQDVIWVCLLPAVDLEHLFPGAPQPMMRRRQVVFDGLSQTRQVEERHGGEHVVLDVILHVPIEKRRQPRAGERAAAEAVIGHVRRHAVVLGKTAEKSEPAAILRAQVEDENQEPMPGRDKHCRQNRVPDQREARPVPVFPAQFLIGFRQHEFEPLIVQAARGAPVIGPDGFSRRDGIPGKQAQPELPVLERKLLRQHHLAVVIIVSGDLVMANVARSKRYLVPPPEEREHLEEEFVDRFGFERRLVAEFVTRRSTQKRAESSVHKQRRQQDRDRPHPIGGGDMPKRHIRQNPGDAPKPEMSQRLPEAMIVAAPDQLAHNLRIDLAAVPSNRRVLAEFKRVADGREKHGPLNSLLK